MSERKAKWLLGTAAAILFVLGYFETAWSQGAFPVPSNQISITGSVNTATRIVTVPSGKQIVVTALLQALAATSVVTYTYGGGATCATAPTGTLSGAMTTGAGAMISWGNGSGPVIVVPPGSDLCVTIATAVAPGSLVYTTVP